MFNPPLGVTQKEPPYPTQTTKKRKNRIRASLNQEYQKNTRKELPK
jgi:hypothetical protein